MMETEAPRATGVQNRPGAIVLGGNFVGLGIVRSLGRRGIPTWVIDTDRSKSIAQFSRFTRRFIESREPLHELLLNEGRMHHLNGWVLFPVNDECVETLSTNHASLSSIYRLVTPPLGVTKFALDKRLTYQRAEELGIAVPWTVFGKPLADLATARLPYPLILKPGINHHFFPQTNLKAIAVNAEAELQMRYAQMSRFIPSTEILIQERIPGGGEAQYSYCGLCDGGRVVASLVAQRRRQYPIDFGNASTFVETTVQPDVESAGRRFLESIGFDGIAEVEFKFDVRDGRYKILDANPRPWGWHTLGEAAGIDFAYQVWRLKSGLGVANGGKQTQAAWCREMTDVLALLKAPNRGAEIKRLLNAIRTRNFTSATFSLADPVPFFAEFVLWASSGISRQKKAKDFLQLQPAE